ncbi:MAG: C39 family peptidase [Verrucomicrobiota bacterium]
MGAKSAEAEPANRTDAAAAPLGTATPLGPVAPIDWRHRIEARELARSGKGAWTSPLVKAGFPFDELIYYWNVRLPRDEGFRLYLQVEFGPGDASPWLYAGFWGNVRLSAKRTKPSFDRGRLDEDTLLLKAKATGYRFKVVNEGETPLTVLPALGVIATDTTPTAALASRYRPGKTSARAAAKVLDVPLRLQADVCGNPLKDRCQSAALASAMQYFGKPLPLEQIICYTTDPEYESFGIWPRTINAAVEHGFSAYLDRFRDWEAVRQTVGENKVILCSITMPASSEYIAPPYEKMEGHIVALCGVTEDGRVIVTDSASSAQKAKEGGHCLQWLQADFEKVWMRNKGGVGMVICPPENAPELVVRELRAYPRPVPPGKHD